MGEQVRTRARLRLGRQQVVSEKPDALDVEAAQDLGGFVGRRRVDGRGIFLAGAVGEVLEHGERGEALLLELVVHMSSRISARRVRRSCFIACSARLFTVASGALWRSAISVSDRPS